MLCGFFKSCLVRENQLHSGAGQTSDSSLYCLKSLGRGFSAQQTAALVNIAELAIVFTMAVTEALKAAGVGQTTPLASPTMVNPSPGCVDASATVETARAAEIASISSMSALGRHGPKSRLPFCLYQRGNTSDVGLVYVLGLVGVCHRVWLVA